MSETYEYIDHYFKENISPEEAMAFERKITSDPAFAEEVAFYCATQQVAQEQLVADKKKRFLELYREQQQRGNAHAEVGGKLRTLRPAGKWMRIAAAAAVIAGLVVGLMMWNNSPAQIANGYLDEKLASLGANMGTTTEIETGRSLYNEKKYEAALLQFEKIIKEGDTGIDVRKYAGITCLRLEKYDSAINYFQLVENYQGVYSNPGKFYHALALMKRNKPGDKNDAKLLLRGIVDGDLYGKDKAIEWLNKM